MPGLNQKGPMEQGSMSGRKMGKCTNFGTNVKQQTSVASASTAETLPENNSVKGFGAGKGMVQGGGMGLGRQHRFRRGQ
jgi:hypothetical protein